MTRTKTARILIVEDEWLIAQSISDELERNGYLVLGPAASVAQAEALVAQFGADGAVLDVGLGPEKSFSFALSLKEKGIPFLFLSGYTRADLPHELSHTPLVMKPVNQSELLGAVAQLELRP